MDIVLIVSVEKNDVAICESIYDYSILPAMADVVRKSRIICTLVFCLYRSYIVLT